MALLAAEALDFGDRDALHTDRRQGFSYFVKLEWLDDGGNQFHFVLHIQRRTFPPRLNE